MNTFVMNQWDPMNRRAALRHFFVFSASGFLWACSRKPSCTDVTGLSPEDVTQRLNTAGYADNSPDPAKKCSGCAQFQAGSGCGTCKVIKGPINPEGTCKLWVARPA